MPKQPKFMMESTKINLEIPGGGRGEGGFKQKNFEGGGMHDIFWNHTFSLYSLILALGGGGGYTHKGI